MIKFCVKTLLVGLVMVIAPTTVAADDEYETIRPPRKLTAAQSRVAASNYKKYCTLCHGEDRQGYVNDHAPSLRSKSLFQSGVPHEVLRALSYGREGTAMGGYLDEVGGPLTLDETWNLTYWLFWQANVDRVRIGKKLIEGDVSRGEVVYKANCTSCHGENGEGVNAPALGNQSALAHNSDEFIRYAIRNGREDTPMIAWKDTLSDTDIDNVTAFLRSKANGWAPGKLVLKKLPTPDQYVINKDGADPDFELSEGLYVSSVDLLKAVQEKRKMVLLDTRVSSVWQRVHIEGAIPMPYYGNFDKIAEDLPKDVQIVAYCSCPRAAADYVVRKLRRRGFTRTAVLYEGIFGWMNLGFPVMRGEVE
ncbi:MAG: cytochrome c, diheme subunit of cytochrome bc complex peta [Kordiimonadales bacterium]|nr:MAG: cytochrome c, diheme subunit of cytochrome bc complex peta [Kordiimonadales bacterium]